MRTRLVLIALPLLSAPNAANSRWEQPTHPSGRAARRIAFNAHGDKAYVTNEWNWVNIIQ